MNHLTNRAATPNVPFEVLLLKIVRQIRAGSKADHVRIFLLNDDHNHLELVAATGEHGQPVRELQQALAVESPTVIGQAVRDSKPCVIQDTAAMSTRQRLDVLLPGTRSEMALPLITHGQTLGVLDLQSDQPNTFSDEDASALVVLAEVTALAIDNARRCASTEARANDMAFLFQVTNAAATSGNLDEALAQIVNSLCNTMNATSATVFLPDAAGDAFKIGASVGAASVPGDQGLVGWVSSHREPVIIADLSRDARCLHTVETPRSAIVMPLIAGDVLTGVLALESDRPSEFDADNLHLLQKLSTSLATTIEKLQRLREMQTINEQLLEVDRLKTNFLAAMSHELRTPLNSIIGFSRIMLKGIDGPLTDLQEQDLTTIHDSGKHLLGLVNDLLDQAKLEAGKMKLVFDFFEPHQMITGVMSSAVGLIEDKPIALQTAIDDTLPQAYGDEFRTRQILLNLVSNAAKFTEEGSITVSAFPVEDQGQQYVQISVTDTGIGIGTDDIPKLFEAFQQADNSLTRKVGGTGMGLPLARSLTELQHGRLWVESELGSGSTFSFTLPTEPVVAGDGNIASTTETRTSAVEISPTEQAKIIRETEDKPAPAEKSRPDDDLPPPTKIALVIEDNERAISPYKRYLAPEGYDVVGVTDPTSVSFTLAIRPTLILVDVSMNDGAGWNVLEELKTSGNAPVIVCSANSNRQHALALGAAMHVDKPLTEDQLVSAVRQAEAQLTT